MDSKGTGVNGVKPQLVVSLCCVDAFKSQEIKKRKRKKKEKNQAIRRKLPKEKKERRNGLR